VAESAVPSTFHGQAGPPDRAWLGLLDEIRPRVSAVVAFSGGVDSGLVLRAAVAALGSRRVPAVTGRSPSVPAAELTGVAELAAEMGAPHEFLDTREFEDPNYLANPSNRCYFCKTELYGRLAGWSADRGYQAVLTGVNADDLSDHRPGIQAAREHGVHAPLADRGLGKSEVRRLAALQGISIADKPASPCLSSRVQYGESITPEKLARIDRAETLLRSLGFRECRVRHHDDLARVEVPVAEIDRLLQPALREQIERGLRDLGYRYVTLDLRGFRSGSMNEAILGQGLSSRVATPPRSDTP